MFDEDRAFAFVPQYVVIIGLLSVFDKDQRCVDSIGLEGCNTFLAVLIIADRDTCCCRQPEAGAGNRGVGGIADTRNDLIEFVRDLIAETHRDHTVLIIDVAGYPSFFQPNKRVDKCVADRQYIECHMGKV